MYCSPIRRKRCSHRLPQLLWLRFRRRHFPERNRHSVPIRWKQRSTTPVRRYALVFSELQNDKRRFPLHARLMRRHLLFGSIGPENQKIKLYRRDSHNWNNRHDFTASTRVASSARITGTVRPNKFSLPMIQVFYFVKPPLRLLSCRPQLTWKSRDTFKTLHVPLLLT